VFIEPPNGSIKAEAGIGEGDWTDPKCLPRLPN